VTGIFAAEGGYQEFVLKGGEWLVLWLAAAAAILAIAVGLFLVRSVLAADEGTPKMKEIALAIQEGALAYLKRQFKTIGLILIPLAVIVFITSTKVLKGDGVTEALSQTQAGIWRTVAFILGGVFSGLIGYIGMTLATRGNVRTAAAALTGSMPKALPACLLWALASSVQPASS
jgi:K(+)-stimulated pyrophosphate-energized sodium pump